MNSLTMTALAAFSSAVAFGQNSVTISQSGGSGNSASVSQSGQGNSVSISQTGGAGANGSKPGNRVSLLVPKGTETTISQRAIGPNTVEIAQEGQATATISQSSEIGDNSIHTLPGTPDGRSKMRSSKRRNRRQP